MLFWIVFILKIYASFNYSLFFTFVVLIISVYLVKKEKSFFEKTIILLLSNIPIQYIILDVLVFNNPSFIFVSISYFIFTAAILFFSRKLLIFIYVIIHGYLMFYTFPSVAFESLKLPIEPEKDVAFNFINLQTNKSVHDYNKGKKILILSFFNTWCKPCIREFPELKRIQSRYEKEVDIVLICPGKMDRDREKVEFFYKKHGLEMPLWYDVESVYFKGQGLSGVPSMIIFDKERNIIHKQTGYNDGIGMSYYIGQIIEENQ